MGGKVFLQSSNYICRKICFFALALSIMLLFFISAEASAQGDTSEIRFSTLGSSHPVRRNLTADGCRHETFYLNVDSFKWTGSCVDGKISGSGTLRYYQGPFVTHLVYVGENSDLHLTDGKLYHSKNINFVLKNIRVDPSTRYYGQRVLDVSVLGPDRLNLATPDALAHITSTITASPEVKRVRDAHFAKKKEGVPWLTYRFSGNPDIGKFQLRIHVDGTIPDGSTYHRIVPRSLEALLKKENQGAIRDQKIQQANVRAQQIYEVQQQREIYWEALWFDQLNGNKVWANTADMLRVDLSKSLIKLGTGQRILISIDSISIANDLVYVRSNQRFTNIYEGIPRNELVNTQLLKLTEDVGRSNGYTISCSMPFDVLAKISEGQNYSVDVKLKSFSGTELGLECKNPQQ